MEELSGSADNLAQASLTAEELSELLDKKALSLQKTVKATAHDTLEHLSLQATLAAGLENSAVDMVNESKRLVSGCLRLKRELRGIDLMTRRAQQLRKSVQLLEKELEALQ
ncbi:hypothetical protein WJX74_006205 [Apatococcus lobatus]|uniref:Biogenesis of lysosome-related organelles complex 1 subunit 7 n=2 Tax=Apatococcus TaxID=904362 RepID=A0AAW1SQS9_9CHLO